MSLAEYYDRSAVAASQVVAGFNAEAFHDAVSDTVVGIALDDNAATSPEGQAALDLSVRLMARLYPALAIRAEGSRAVGFASELGDLARSINPKIDLVEHAETGIVVGAVTQPWAHAVYAGSDGWVGRVSMAEPIPIGRTLLPFGGGVAACLAASAIFRALLDHSASRPGTAQLCSWTGPIDSQLPASQADGRHRLPERTVLVGAGAIGQAASWAIARSPLAGVLHVVDGELLDLGNMQRYVLTGRTDLDQPKAALAANHINHEQARLGGQLRAVPHPVDWVGALLEAGPTWDCALAAVDSAAARRAVQAALPRWVANAWTQPGDLGVSEHDFITGACLACLYLPTGTTRNEDQLVADALGIPEHRADVRMLLYTGDPPADELLALIAARLGVDPDVLTAFRQRSIRELYVEGICGGAVLPLGSIEATANVHVPLAHQSALAGVLLAARLARQAAGISLGRSEVTRFDVRRDPIQDATLPVRKGSQPICICQDADYTSAYAELWGN